MPEVIYVTATGMDGEDSLEAVDEGDFYPDELVYLYPEEQLKPAKEGIRLDRVDEYFDNQPEIDFIEVDPIRFRDAFVKTANMMSRESGLYHFNVHFMTNPVAIAVYNACSMMDSGHVIDREPYHGDTYSWQEAQVLNIISTEIPEKEERRDLLLGFHQTGTDTVVDVLTEMNVISEEVPEDPEGKKERNRKLQRYHDHKESLKRDGYLEEFIGISPTSKGESTAELIAGLEDVETLLS